VNSRRDARAGLIAALLVAVAAAVAGALAAAGHPVHASAAPVFGHWRPHVGPGTPVAITLGVLVVVHGPALAARLRWPQLLLGGYSAAAGWTFALALIDGWHRGLAGRLTTPFEYLSEVPGVTSIPAMLRGFTGRILDGTADPWTTHVAGHPPGALLVFVVLNRLGLGGGGWAAIVCVLAGSTVAVSVPVTLRALGAEPAARAAVPFLVLFPGAVWIGASADGLFAGVAAAGLAVLAVALTRGSVPAGVAAGAVLAGGLYLNYGLILLAFPALAVILLSPRRPVVVLAAAAVGFAIVVAAFAAAGFWWVDGYVLVRERYYQGLASRRPSLYWVWADLAALTLSAGPAAAPILRRAARLRPVRACATVESPPAAPAARARRPAPVSGFLSRTWRPAPVSGFLVRVRRSSGVWDRIREPAAVLPCAAFAAILLADLSGLSKAETERIWLPFAVWLMAGAGLLPARSHRGWLAVQAATALLVNHLILTAW
jgi:hypothetical protein